ncbi:hypothetical protein L195_g047913, partial [Trifolium pratense]
FRGVYVRVSLRLMAHGVPMSKDLRARKASRLGLAWPEVAWLAS